MQRIDPSGLPPGWGSPVAPSRLRGFGDEWLAAGKSPVLAVPSAVVRGEWNYLFDPAHSEFARMPKSAPEPFAFDARLR